MRHAHPFLYKRYIMFAVLSIALGLNFIFLTPAFMPFGIAKWPPGAVLVGCGVTKLALLLMNRERRTLLRLSMALSVTIYSFWGAALAFEFFRLSQTSLQLPLTYIGLAALGFLLLGEPFNGPSTLTAPKVDE